MTQHATMPRPDDAASSIAAVRLIVGLEVHVQLATRTKMFSRAPNPAHAEFESAGPNELADPTVLGLPGALPVMNRDAVEMAMLVGLALCCRIASFTKWDRKSYFYPDLPKGYQISQYDLPLCFDGVVDVAPMDEHGAVIDGPATRVGIIRAHLEEDSGKLLHELPAGAGPGSRAMDDSIVDFNRAGAPLLEVVTGPDFGSADAVLAFARQLRGLCRFLGVSEGVMQKGHMRFEPNINTELTLRDGRVVRTPVVEIKNLNSFRSLRAAVEFEHAAQPARWAADGREMGRGMKRTMGWDEDAGATVVQRDKEDAHEYRYFPDPDLPPVIVTDAWRDAVRARLPDPPLARMARYRREAGLSAKEAAALVDEREVAEFYEAVAAAMVRSGIDNPRAGRLAANFLLQNGAKRANERGVLVSRLGISAGQIAGIARLREAGAISSSAADELFGLLCERGSAATDPEVEARERGLLLVRDTAALEAWCEAVLSENGAIADQIKGGKVAAVGRLVGLVMKASGGQADATEARKRLLSRLGIAE